MYRAHFGLSAQPFGLTPNTEYFLNAYSHQQAFNMLQIALDNSEGFMKVVGEVGTGKTMLCRQLLNTLSDRYVSAYIPNPYLDPISLYTAIAEEFSVDVGDSSSVHRLVHSVNRRLLALAEEGKQPVLVIDEAQSMPYETLEALRLISNLETESSKLIHIVLFGQPELDSILGQENLRQLRQRITFSHTILPFDYLGTLAYVQHRIQTAGYNGNPLFTSKATKLLFQASGGIPRVINILCHKCLMVAYGKGEKLVDKKHMLAAIRDTDGVSLPSIFSLSRYIRMVAAISFVTTLLPFYDAMPLLGAGL